MGHAEALQKRAARHDRTDRQTVPGSTQGGAPLRAVAKVVKVPHATSHTFRLFSLKNIHFSPLPPETTYTYGLGYRTADLPPTADTRVPRVNPTRHRSV